MSEMRCSPRVITFTSLVLGAVGLCTLTLGVSTDFWLYTNETAKTLMIDNSTVDRLICMRSGLWKMCVIEEDIPPMCLPIEYFKQDSERHDNAMISMSITRAIRVSAPMQVFALVFVVLGFLLGVIGGIRQDSRTIAAAVMYIFSGLLVAVGMILYISAINDEVGHGIKSKDGSIFTYSYGWSFIFVGISFVCSELAAVMCISVHISLNAQRDDILRIIPGLEDKLQLDPHIHVYAETEEEMCCKPSGSATQIY